MLSSEFINFPLAEIIIHRDGRQRRELPKIDELAHSIHNRGLINPIVITRDGVLVAGERRLTACTQLGWETIPVQFADELSARDLRLIELEENTRRVDLSWQDQVAAVADLHELYLAEDDTWKPEHTAEALGLSESYIRQMLSVNAEINRGNELVTSALHLSTAYAATVRTAQRRRADLVSSVMAIPLNSDPSEPELDLQIPAVPRSELIRPRVPIYNADVTEFLKTYTGDPFNFIHCDFPYGQNFQKSPADKSANKERYADDFETYRLLLEEVLPSIPKSTQCHLMFWFSMTHFEYTKLQLIKQGWIVNPFPLYWAKTDNLGILPDPQRGPRRIVETAFMASRGDRLIVKPVSNFIGHPRGDVTHPSQKPRPVLSHFFRMFVDETTIMLDPTCGSGAAVKAAHDAGARSVCGVELDPTFHADAVRLWDEIDV